MRFFFVGAALLLLLGATVAFGDGTYERTKDGKTFVWNNEPKPGEEATWSGDRDREGYAAGFGTLTWYTGQKQIVRHLGIPVATSGVYARYFGNMVRGQFNGPVNVHVKEKTDHAIFVDGVRTTRWAAGSAPSWRVAQQPSKVAKRNVAVKQPASAKRPGVAEPEAPAEGPRSVQSPAVKAERPEIPEKPVDRAVAKSPPIRKSQAEVENSLQALVGPPSSLHAIPETTPSPEANPRLTKEEVVDLADAEARRRGYDLAEYQRTEPQHNTADETWSLSYDRHAVEGAEEADKNFSVTVDDKTKGTVFVPRR